MCFMKLGPLELKIYTLFQSLVVSCRFYSVKTFKLDLVSNIINLLSGGKKYLSASALLRHSYASIKRKNNFKCEKAVFSCILKLKN